jgi:hypothetical protein
VTLDVCGDQLAPAASEDTPAGGCDSFDLDVSHREQLLVEIHLKSTESTVQTVR